MSEVCSSIVAAALMLTAFVIVAMSYRIVVGQQYQQGWKDGYDTATKFWHGDSP